VFTVTSGTAHVYEILHDVEQQVKSKFRTFQQNVSSKLNIMDKQLKIAGKGIDDVPERCNEIKQEIKRKTDEQVLKKHLQNIY